jgi:GH24 family phage-related lysozyme (muramidase)
MKHVLKPAAAVAVDSAAAVGADLAAAAAVEAVGVGAETVAGAADTVEAAAVEAAVAENIKINLAKKETQFSACVSFLFPIYFRKSKQITQIPLRVCAE